MKLKLILLLHIFLSIVCYAQNDSDLLKDHYRELVAKHLANGDVSSARHELNNAKRVAPEIYPDLKGFEGQISKLEMRQKEIALKKRLEKEAKEREDEAKAIQRKKDESERQKQLALEREIKWEKSLPERRCACLELIGYTDFLIQEENKIVKDLIKLKQYKDYRNLLKDSVKVLDEQGVSKKCPQYSGIQNIASYKKREELIENRRNLCDTYKILYQ